MLPGEAPLPAAVDDLQLSNLDYSLEMSRVLGKIISEDCDISYLKTTEIQYQSSIHKHFSEAVL